MRSSCWPALERRGYGSFCRCLLLASSHFRFDFLHCGGNWIVFVRSIFFFVFGLHRRLPIIVGHKRVPFSAVLPLPPESSAFGIALLISPFHSISDLSHSIGALTSRTDTNSFRPRLHRDGRRTLPDCQPAGREPTNRFVVAYSHSRNQS